MYPNFSFKGLRKKKNFVTLFRDYFRHADKLHTSQQQITFTQDAHTRIILLWPQPAGFQPDPGCAINSNPILINSANINILCMIIKLKITELAVEVHITRTSYIGYQHFCFVFMMRA